MNRLTFQITGIIVLVALITIILVVSIQFVNIDAEQQTLPADVRVQLQPRNVLERVLVPASAGRSPVLVIQSPPTPVALPAVPAVPTDVRTFGLILDDLQTRRVQTLLVSGVLSVMLAVMLGLLLSRFISQPIERVSRAAAQLTRGNLSVRVPVPSHAAAVTNETVQLAQSFNVMADTLERFERERCAMIADIAHELRTPLTIMRGRLEAVEDGLAPFDLTEARNLHQQVLLLARLVDDLRTLSLAEAGRLTTEKRLVDLRNIIRVATDQFAAQASQKSITIDCIAPEGVEVLADADRIQQVLVNLLDNALRHTPEGGWVRVNLHTQTQDVILAVTDSGPGLPQGSELQVFERFYRIESGQTQASGGSGLGLSIVKALVELHGGRVNACNSLTGGAQFMVVLPKGVPA